MSHTRLVEVYRARDSIHAHLLKSRLADAGIEARVLGETVQSAMGAVPLGWSILPQLYVDEADAPAARDLLIAIEREAERTAGTPSPPKRRRLRIAALFFALFGIPVQ